MSDNMERFPSIFAGSSVGLNLETETLIDSGSDLSTMFLEFGELPSCNFVRIDLCDKESHPGDLRVGYVVNNGNRYRVEELTP